MELKIYKVRITSAEKQDTIRHITVFPSGVIASHEDVQAGDHSFEGMPETGWTLEQLARWLCHDGPVRHGIADDGSRMYQSFFSVNALHRHLFVRQVYVFKELSETLRPLPKKP